MARVFNFSNFKGGVGKTTTSVITAYILSERGYKTLFVDFDPQSNGTETLMLTASKENFDSTVYQGIVDQDLTPCITPIKEHLDLIPSDLDLINLPLYLNKTVKNDVYRRAYLLDYLLEPIKEDYDYIIIDIPPTISDFTNNAAIASDYVALVMQTQRWSFKATKTFIPYLQDMIDNYDTSIELLGVIPVLMKPDSKKEIAILESAQEEYGDYLFHTTIKIRERLKGFADHGITDNDYHDRLVLHLYEELVSELIERMEANVKQRQE